MIRRVVMLLGRAVVIPQALVTPDPTPAGTVTAIVEETV